ncbi:MAG: DUF2092 domain-containing protein [Nitrosomonas sp.]|nr:DUF2092 domain-containing protein [Nitrosomonas sp.]
MTAFSPSKNVYAQTPKSGGIDEDVKVFPQVLGMRLPLLLLLMSQFPQSNRSHQELIMWSVP